MPLPPAHPAPPTTGPAPVVRRPRRRGEFANLDRDTRRRIKLALRAHRPRRLRRHGRRAYIRSAYSLPSLATLGNAICGFGAMYVSTLTPSGVGVDSWTNYFFEHRFVAAAYLIFIAMLWDAIDGRLARFTR